MSFNNIKITYGSSSEDFSHNSWNGICKRFKETDTTDQCVTGEPAVVKYIKLKTYIYIVTD